MSLSPFLLRPRVNAGLPHISPHPLRLGHPRHVRINPSRPRLIAIPASKFDPLFFDESDLADHKGDSSTVPHPSGLKSQSQPYGNLEDALRVQERQFYRHSSVPGKKPRVYISKFNLKNGRGIEENGVPLIYDAPKSDSSRQLKILEQSILESENQIRAPTLFSSGEDFVDWMADFKLLYAEKFTGRAPGKTPPQCLTLHDADYDLFEKLTLDGQHSFRPAWNKLSREAKAVHWSRLSLYLLYNTPDLAWQFLYVTCQGEDRPPFKMAWDCLDFLYHQFIHYSSREEICGITFQTMIKTVLDPQFWPVVYAPQRAVRLFIKTATHEDVQRALDIVQERQNNLQFKTWLCFMYRFTRYGDVEGALSALRNIRLDDPSVKVTDVEYHCCKLLMLDWVCDEPGGRNFYILPRILELGIQPTRNLMNVVLSKAFKTGDSQLGHDIFEYMKSQGHAFDSFTYLSLLQDAVDRGDKNRVEELSEEIRLRPDLSRNPWIATKLMHAHYLSNVKSVYPETASSTHFFSLLDMYNQLYDLTPLKELGILSSEYNPAEAGENNPPPTIALYLLMSTYIRSQNKLGPVVRLYSKWRSLAWQGHPTIAPMQVTEHVYNEFLASFRRKRKGVRPALRLIEDMVEGRPGSAFVNGEAITPAKPSTWTWNILLSIFVYHDQPHAKERVIKLMAKNNIKFDAVTWNTIISGQVCEQKIPDLARTMKSMEEDGIPFDAHTMKALSFLRDPERLWTAVKELDGQGPEPPVDQVKHDTQNSPTTEPGTAGEGEQEDEDDELLVRGLQRLIKPGRRKSV